MTGTDRDAVVGRIKRNVETLDEVGVVAIDNCQLQKTIRSYESDWDVTVAERAEETDVDTVVRDVVLSYLRATDSVLTYPPQSIYGYDAYCELVDWHVDLTDGLLDGVDCEATGDWTAGDDGRLRVRYEGHEFDRAVAHMDDYVDTGTLYSLLNDVISEIWNGSRRFHLLGVDTHTAAFLRPEQAEVLEAMLRNPCDHD